MDFLGTEIDRAHGAPEIEHGAVFVLCSFVAALFDGARCLVAELVGSDTDRRPRRVMTASITTFRPTLVRPIRSPVDPQLF
jgi:hypothetical protein